MKPALITGTAAAFAYLAVMATRTIHDLRTERANRTAWNMYRSTH